MTFKATISGIAYQEPVLHQNLADLANNDDWIYQFLHGYRRPVLQFISVTQIDVENNTGTANQTKIIFPDMSIRTVIEDTASTNKYRRFDITAAANFTSGTEDSGLYSALSEANNTWYAIYAVKSQINVLNFVLVGDTTLPLQANYATLNSRYGTDSWVYLGMIRNGDNNPAPGDLLDFVQAGGYTRLKNGSGGVGIEFGRSAGAASVSYAPTQGTGTTDIPNHFPVVEWVVEINDTSNFMARDFTNARTYSARHVGASNAYTNGWFWRAAANEGFYLSKSSGNIAPVIYLAGWFDKALGLGINPLI